MHSEAKQLALSHTGGKGSSLLGGGGGMQGLLKPPLPHPSARTAIKVQPCFCRTVKKFSKTEGCICGRPGKRAIKWPGG